MLDNNIHFDFQVDNLSTGLSKSEEMALMKKLGALEIENKELKKGKPFVHSYQALRKPWELLRPEGSQKLS